jgi:hypothetical protein
MMMMMMMIMRAQVSPSSGSVPFHLQYVCGFDEALQRSVF